MDSFTEANIILIRAGLLSVLSLGRYYGGGITTASSRGNFSNVRMNLLIRRAEDARLPKPRR